MVEDLDPYHRWLGIPAEEQPANHYRLLGLVQFESDPEVIRDAAERQMAHVRRYGLGKHAELSQRILNELARARACLLEPGKKAAYDERLRARVAAKSAPPGLALKPALPRSGDRPPLRTSRVLPHETAGRVDDLSFVADAIVTSPASPHKNTVTAAGESPGPVPASVSGKPVWLLAGITTCVLAGGLIVWAGVRTLGPKPAILRLELVAAKTVEVGGELRLPVRTSEPSQWEGKVRYSLGPGSPMGAAVDPQTGSFLWKPQATGLCEITVQAASLADDGQKAATTFSVQVVGSVIPVVKIKRPPKLAPLDPVQINQRETLCIPMRIKDRGTAGGMIRYSLRSGGPPGVVINEQTGVLSWTPEWAGSYHICVVATDAENLTDETTLSVEVKRLRQRPQLAPISPRTAAADRQTVIVVSVSDPDTPRDRLRFSLLGAPDWVRINPVSGVVSCTPPEDQIGQECEVTVRVEDDSPTPLFDEQMLTIRVAGSGPRVSKPVVRLTPFQLTFPSGRQLCDERCQPTQRGKTKGPGTLVEGGTDEKPVVALLSRNELDGGDLRVQTRRTKRSRSVLL